MNLSRMACKKGGSVEELLKMKEEGIIRHVGFSTHAPLTNHYRAPLKPDCLNLLTCTITIFFNEMKQR